MFEKMYRHLYNNRFPYTSATARQRFPVRFDGDGRIILIIVWVSLLSGGVNTTKQTLCWFSSAPAERTSGQILQDCLNLLNWTRLTALDTKGSNELTHQLEHKSSVCINWPVWEAQ